MNELMRRRRSLMAAQGGGTINPFGVFIVGGTLTTTASKVKEASSSQRMRMQYPVPNNGYIFRTADATKYQICACDVTNPTPTALNPLTYQSTSKPAAWKNEDYATADYVWLACKKLDGTEFSGEESKNPIGKVFTFTQTQSLVSSAKIELSTIYNTDNENHGFTCTGLAYNLSNDTFLIGDIGKLQPGGGSFSNAIRIVRFGQDYKSATYVGAIDVSGIVAGAGTIQGITVDTSDGTIWFCAQEEKKIYNIDTSGTVLGSISLSTPVSGIAYAADDDSFWIANSNQKNLQHIRKDGVVLSTISFAYADTPDQIFLDENAGKIYMTAGENYSGENYVYCIDINTQTQAKAFFVDSYSVEGIWIGSGKMLIANDGYYHSAKDPYNQINVYNI